MLSRDLTAFMDTLHEAVYDLRKLHKSLPPLFVDNTIASKGKSILLKRTRSPSPLCFDQDVQRQFGAGRVWMPVPRKKIKTVAESRSSR